MPAEFADLFRRATDHDPFPFQSALAQRAGLPRVVRVPTGAGKTAAAVLGWIYRRRYHPDAEIRRSTPRRLVYCLPMRVLVEQTRDSAVLWLHRLGLLGGVAVTDGTGDEERVTRYEPSWDDPTKIVVSTLMGGEDDGGWDLYPERDAILVGTQDMLLSRALNRGYGMSRYRWPMHFGLLNDDCLWVADEVQLFGAGLATTTQMQAFRRLLGTHHPVPTLWMSATMDPGWLETVDFVVDEDAPGSLGLSPDDEREDAVGLRLRAPKTLHRAHHAWDRPVEVAEKILSAHRAGTRTLVVVNTVMRAVALYEALGKESRASKRTASLVLVHSRFRPRDRERALENLLAEPGDAGTIVVSTQVIEAGVDVTSATLFAELAPWASLVQRFGRCNRAGEIGAGATVYWIDLPRRKDGESAEAYEKRLARESLPYEPGQLRTAREVLLECSDVGPASLPDVALNFKHGHVVRRRDVIELFDTTPDLTGHDIDVSRFIRESDDTDMRVFWRDVSEDGPPAEEPQPHRDELCSAPISDVRVLVKKKVPMWHWDSLDEEWRRVEAGTPLYPGLTLMLRSAEGRYTEREGWRPESRASVSVVPGPTPRVDSRYSGDPMAERKELSLQDHADLVVAEAARLLDGCGIGPPWRDAVIEAARWHDAGKAHPIFQRTMHGSTALDGRPLLAKSGHRGTRYQRDVGGKTVSVPFRHELVSALLALQHDRPDLVAYLAASHHGKVRLSIRSLPNEPRPNARGARFARGVWDGDQTLEADLGAGVSVPPTRIDLSYMELGEVRGHGLSWLARMLALRDDPDLGPFRLAFLEALMKAADERASGGAT